MKTQEDLNVIRELNISRYKKHLHQDLDPTSIILKGHLFIEELLMDIIKLQCRDTSPIENIQLSFHHKLKLAQALYVSHLPIIQGPEGMWSVLDNFNQLRNAMAHEIDSPRFTKKLNAFISSYEQLSIKEVNMKLDIPVSTALYSKRFSGDLLSIIYSILGALGFLQGIAFLNPPSMNSEGAMIIIPDEV